MHGPINEPKAYGHLRAIRVAIDAAGEHLLAVQRTKRLEGPDRQLLDDLRVLDMWSGTNGAIPR